MEKEIFVVSLLWTLSAASNVILMASNLVEFNRFVKNPTVVGGGCLTGESFITKSSPSSLHCIFECDQYTDCIHVFYQESNKVCYGCTSLNYQLESLEGSSNYVKAEAYVGCYDNLLEWNDASFKQTSNMTNTFCIKYCTDRGFKLAGTTLGDECHCGLSADSAVLRPDDECNYQCQGHPSQICGASERFSVYVAFIYKPSSKIQRYQTTTTPTTDSTTSDYIY